MKQCQACNIHIDQACDEAYTIVVTDEDMTVCDACYMDHMLWGDDFVAKRWEVDERMKVGVPA